MKDLLIQIVKALVDNPEQVQVNEIVRYPDCCT